MDSQKIVIAPVVGTTESKEVDNKIVDDSSMSISSSSSNDEKKADYEDNQTNVAADTTTTTSAVNTTNDVSVSAANANTNAVNINQVIVVEPESKNDLSVISTNETIKNLENNIKNTTTIASTTAAATPVVPVAQMFINEKEDISTNNVKINTLPTEKANLNGVIEESNQEINIAKPNPTPLPTPTQEPVEVTTTSNGKRDRDTAFEKGNDLEKIPPTSKDSDIIMASPSPVIEPPQKVARVDSVDDSSQDPPKKDASSSDDSSNDGNYIQQTDSRQRFDSDTSIRSSTINRLTDGSSTNGTIPNGDQHETSNTNGEADDDEYEMPDCDEYFLSLLKLDPIPIIDHLPRLLPREVAQLELALQIGLKFKDHSDDYTWRDDWNGNLQLIDKDLIMNREALAKNPMAKRITISFCDWVAKFARHADDFGCVNFLFTYIYNMKGTPPMAKRIMAYYLQRPAASIAERLKFIEQATDRISYDPIVLKQDGWTTAKCDAPDGASGGAFLIGRKILWQRTVAIIIAFVRDEGLGDLWKCMWVEDLDTFDLEADELQEGIKRWERKALREREKSNSKPAKGSKVQKASTSSRFEQNRNFSVKGVEDGIVLATSYKAKNGRPWPARIMHVTEVKAMGQLSTRRSSSKNEIHVVFLAPYWNAQSVRTTKAKSSYSTGALFELETIDVSEDTIQPYPHDIKNDSLYIEKLRSAFNFLGLPKSAFARYLDSHRIALSLKAYASSSNAKTALDKQSSHVAIGASLADTHPLSVRTFLFPDALLNLPFEYTLEKYPPHSEKAIQGSYDIEESKEPIMKLNLMLESLCPPKCWGVNNKNENMIATKIHSPYNRETIPQSPSKTSLPRAGSIGKESFTIQNFCSKYLIDYMDGVDGKFSLKTIKTMLEGLVINLNQCIAEVESVSTPDVRQKRLRTCLLNCMIVKSQGEDYLFGPNLPKELSQPHWILEWRKACERIFKRALVRMGHVNAGNGVTAVLTDSRCNQHITARGSFERAVRLPAAIRGAKNAGAGTKQSMPLVTKIDESYMELAEQKIIPMVHKASYLRRLKDKIAALPQDAKGVPLTDDSDGEGGEDTMGSRGSYTAAVTGVAAALKAVDMVVGGKCVNSFCAIRPPGHHAGRELRPMNAISNGFCLLNAAACAALYAASPFSEGGLGLKRVCVVDIDVHHGNGTQDVLASTYDPRFLYISTHAGGPHINGYSDDKPDDGIRRSLNNKDGIFPGRCGDTSPHRGVLNLPLGQKITPSALGTALVCQVTPAIEEFSPELIIISAGFDAHKNDPLGLGGLSAEDFGTVTKVLCQVALKICSGRVISILEGGYGVPCCRPLDPNLFLPPPQQNNNNNNNTDMAKNPTKLLKLGDDLPSTMEDPVDILLAQKLDKCHQEGFMDCVSAHVLNLSTSSDVEPRQG